MANLTAVFELVDKISDKLDVIANKGSDTVDTLENMGDAADQSFSGATTAADGVVSAVSSYSRAASEATAQTDYWTDAVGNYDKSALEAVYSTEELVDMGMKSVDALNQEANIMAQCDAAAKQLSDALEESSQLQDEFAEASEKASKIAEEVANNDKVSQQAKERLQAATEDAAQAFEELESAQNAAKSAMANYDSVMSGGTASLEDMEAAAQQAADAAAELESANNRAASATDELSDAASSAADEAETGGNTGIDAIKGIASALAAAGIVDALKEIGTAAYEMADSFSEAEKVIATSTGATGQELDALMQSTKDIYANSNAESVQEIASGMSAIAQSTNLTGDALEEATQKGYQLQDLMGFDMQESARTASSLMENFGITASEAYDIITVGAQNGANKNGDLLDVLNEYSNQFSALGLSADQFVTTLVSGAEAGVFSIDKVGDAVKEFNIRAKDGSDTSAEAFKLLGMNADIMTEKFASGGETASTAFYEVVNALEAMDDPVQKNTAAVALFGTQYEDLESNLLPILSSVESGTLDTANALDDAANSAQSMSDKWQQAGNNIKTAFASALEPTISKFSGGLASVTSAVGSFLSEHPTLTKAITAIGTGLGIAAVAIAGVATATTVVIPTITALGTAINTALGPIGWISIGLTAVVAAGAAFAAMMSDTEEQVADYDGTMEECASEIERTQAAYEKACELYGENSAAAQELSDSLDTLNAQYAKGGGDVAVYAEKAEALATKMEELTTAQQEAMDAIDGTETSGMVAVSMLSSMSEKANITNADLDMMSQYADYLNDTFSCNIEVNYDTGELTGFDPKTITNTIIAAANDERYQTAIESLSGAEFQGAYVNAKKGVAEYTAELNKLRIEYDQATNIDYNSGNRGTTSTTTTTTTSPTQTQTADTTPTRSAEEIQADIDSVTASLEQEQNTLATAEAQIDEFGATIDSTGEFAETYKETLDEMAKSTDDIADATEDANDSLSDEEQAAQAAADAFSNMKDNIDTLCEAYDAAYATALESFQGQFGLFDQASTESEEYMNATVANAQAALDSQLAYWTEYGNNIEVLKSTSASDLGITQENYNALMSYVQSGSEEAAGLAASMVSDIQSGHTDTVAELANTLGDVNAKQEEISSSVADWQTNFTEQINSAVSSMESAVSDMGFEDEASQAALKTMQSYASSIQSGSNEAVTQAEAVASQISAALEKSDVQAKIKAELDTSAVDKYEMPDKTATAEYELESKTVDDYQPEDKSADAVYEVDDSEVRSYDPPDKTATVTYNVQTNGTVPGHATGTTYAEDMFIAGENGPELIVGQQGSTVFPHSETEQIIDAMSKQNEAVTVVNEYEPTGFMDKLESAFTKLTSRMSAIFDKLGGVTPTVELEGYASGTTASEDSFIAGENGPELIVNKPDSTVFPADETDRIINAIGTSSIAVGDAGRQDGGIFVPTGNDNGLTEDSGKDDDARTRKILLEIAGKGNIELTGGKVDKETMLSFLYEYLKPVLSEILTQEIYEEGDMAYEY